MSDRIDHIIKQIAEEHQLPVSQIRGDMMEAIHAAYTNDDPEARQKFQMIFGDEEPTLERFITEIANLMGPSTGIKH